MSCSSLIGRAVFSQKDSARLAKAHFEGLSTLNSSSLYVFTVLIPMHELISMQKAASRHRGIFMAATQAYNAACHSPKCHKLLSLGCLYPKKSSGVRANELAGRHVIPSL